jgi:hypothetical protein
LLTLLGDAELETVDGNHPDLLAALLPKKAIKSRG